MPYGSSSPSRYVKNCATAHIIYDSVWASMNGAPVQTMSNLARDVFVDISNDACGVLSAKEVRDIAHRFCSDASGVRAFDKIDMAAHPGVRKILNVPFESEDESEKEF